MNLRISWVWYGWAKYPLIFRLSKQGILFKLSVIVDSLFPSRILPLFSPSMIINSTQPSQIKCHTIRDRVRVSSDRMANPYSVFLKFTFILAVLACGTFFIFLTFLYVVNLSETNKSIYALHLLLHYA